VTFIGPDGDAAVGSHGGAGICPHRQVTIDTDGNGVLSKADVLTGINSLDNSDCKILTEEIVKQALGDYGSELPINKDTSKLIRDFNFW